MKAERPIEVLFVDGNEAHARIMREALAVPGVVEHTLRVASSGSEAIDRLFNNAPFEAAPLPDLVLMDLYLPGTPGLDVLKAVKSDPTLRRIPVVMLTRSPRAGDLVECYARGANSVVSRPIPLEELAATMRAVLEYWARTNALPPDPPGRGDG
jgi:CheY-like chemotaxis protein